MSSSDDDLFSGNSDGSDSFGSDGSDEENITSTADCIRKVSNFSAVKPHDLMDKAVFNPEFLNLRLERASPKLVELFHKIKQLDALDRKKHGKVFKHMIFSDQASSSYGVKLIASAMVAKGFRPAFQVRGNGFHVLEDERLRETPDNFGVLISKNFYDRSMSVPFKKALLDKYNRRPDNVHGKLIRFIVLDQGFKEGIDLFDVKYVHLMEPLINKADQKQAIGRGTRFCGQKGLEFHPTYGWPLYVFHYDVELPKKQSYSKKAKTLHELVLEYSDIDLRKVTFAAEIENTTIDGAVDHSLTSPVHGFSIPHPPPILKDADVDMEEDNKQEGGARLNDPIPPRNKLNHLTMKKYIQDHFSGHFTYPAVRLENMCGGAGKGRKKVVGELPPGTLVNFTPTQDFVRHYFTPSSPYKGMLLWHSVGTGKTCTAIATATSGFEPAGYNILWVTRHTLKSDIFKNMFRQVCSLVLQEKLKKGDMTLPKNLAGPMKHLSEQWIEPISYKQFTNLLLKKNKFYEEMVKRNGKTDPLRKTLLIIDEAHKLYSPSVAASEKPNTDILEDMIQNSYQVSGQNSVRLLIMTATPYTDDGMELVKLLNLLRLKKEAFPSEFDDFASKYLGMDGTFTTKGKKLWLDNITGYVSYLNRSKDARNFSYPVIENVHVPMTEEMDEDEVKKIPENGIKFRMDQMKEDFKEAKAKLRTIKREKKAEMKDEYKKLMEKAKEGAKGEVQKCIEEVEKLIEEQKLAFEEAKKQCDEKHSKRGEGDAKKKCKEEAKEDHQKKLVKLKQDKKDCNEFKKNVSRDDVKEKADELLEKALEKHQKEFDDQTKEFRALKEKYDEYAGVRKENSKEIKEMKELYKEIKEQLKSLKARLVQAKLPLKRIKNKEEKKKLQARIREEFGEQMKKTRQDFLDLKEPMTKMKIENKLMRIKQGASTVGDITQGKALSAKCKL
jgi:hypothetical protein